MSISSFLKNILFEYFVKQKRESTTRYELNPVIKDLQLASLNDSEIKAIENQWGGVVMSLNFNYFRLFKTFAGFSTQYVPDDIYVPFIIRTLNRYPYYFTLQDKSLYDTMYAGLPRPKTFAKKVRGTWYDSDMNKINSSEVAELLSGKDFIMKITSGGYGGKSVIKVDGTKDDVEAALRLSVNDVICQEVVAQSKKTAQFNLSSLNTFRISTLNLNGKITADTIIFRHGAKGSIVDNGAAGGVMIGVTHEGRFADFGFDKFLNKYETFGEGQKYADVLIPEVKDLVKLSIDSHRKYLSNCGFAGWDFALNENGRPVFIEVNLGYPGIMMEQICNAKSIFGDRLDEVLDFVRLAKKNLTIQSVRAGAWGV